jgi:hypothetical protein
MVSSGHATARLGENAQCFFGSPFICGAYLMSWTKPEAEVVAVTMEVTAYVATL